MTARRVDQPPPPRPRLPPLVRLPVAFLAAGAALTLPSRPAAAHGLAHPPGPLGTLVDVVQIALAVAFALLVTWTLLDRYAKAGRDPDREQAAPSDNPPRPIDRGGPT